MRRSALASMTQAAARSAPVVEFMPFEGGLNTSTPPLRIPPGFVKSAQNFEVDINGGYRRQTGYERFDGRPKPSDAIYAVLQVTVTGVFAVGNTITGATSGATAVVIATSSAPSYLVITKISGTFLNPETLNVAGSPQGTTSSTANVDGAAIAQLHAQYKNLAADQYRNDITAVPGSRGVLGVKRLNGVTYAFRNNAGGTSVAIYKSSAGGWVNVPLGEEISFTAGNSSVEEGDTLTQGVVTATIKRVVVTSGSSPNLAGRLVIYNRIGGNFAAGAATSTGGGSLTLSGAQTAITIAVDGHYEMVIAKFGGNQNRIYGADGINRGFEFDGTDFSYTPISTGMVIDNPRHVVVHRNYLFFSFGGSAQHSGIGTPYIWSPVSGAAELATGDDITGFMIEPGSSAGAALSIFNRNHIHILYGSSIANWVLVQYRSEVGAYEYSIQQLGFTLMLDDRGVTSLQTVLAYGNFAHATLTNQIQDFINEKRTKISASSIARDKSQYRLFFIDKSALYITIENNKVRGMLPQAFAHDVKVIDSVEEQDGSESIFFGSSNGMVYQLDKGTSFDGDAIEHYLYLVFNPSRSPRRLKHYRQASFEILGNGYAEFNFSYELGYASSNIEQPGTQTIVAAFSGSAWDSFTWDSFIWDGQTLSPSEADMDGTAENVSLRIYGNSDYFFPVKFSGSHVHYSPRRAMR